MPRSPYAALVTSSLLLLLTACTTDDPRPSAGQSRTSTAGRPTPHATDSAECLDRQEHLGLHVRVVLQRLVQRVLSAPAEVEPDAAAPLADALRVLGKRARNACHGAPSAVAPLARQVDALTEQTPDKPALRRAAQVFDAFADEVRMPGFARIMFYAHPCDLLRKHVHVSYEVVTRPEPGGKVGWVQLSLVNNWDREVFVVHHGRVQVTGMRPSGSTRAMVWGGSSGDSFGGKAGRRWTTRARPTPLNTWVWRHPIRDGKIPLFRWGDLELRRIGGFASGHVLACSLRFERAH